MTGLKTTNIIRLILFFSLLLIPFGNAFCGGAGSAGTVKQGELDLRDTGIPGNGIISLQGQWLFYWKKTIPPADFNTGKVVPGGTYRNVPSYWTAYRDENGQRLSSTGYATYFIRILLPAGFRDSLGFSLPVFDSAFDLYINGKKEGGNGEVGEKKDSEIPGYSPFDAYVHPVTDTLNVVIHVSNFNHRRGGFWKVILMGTPPLIRERSDTNVLVVYLSLGFLLAFFLFFLSFFIVIPRSKTSLFFAIAIAGIFLRLFATNIFAFHSVFGTSWLWLIRTEYLGNFFTLIFGVWFLYTLFPGKVIWYLTMVNTVVSAICTVVILVTGVRVFSWTMLYLEPVALLFLIYYLFTVTRSIFKKPVGNVLYFLALLFFVLALLNDILLSNSRPAASSEYLLHFSVLFLIFVQAFMIIRQWVDIYVEKEQLLEKNEFMNANLEKLVNDRTRELDERNLEIKAKSRKISLQNDELQREIDFKNRFFSILAHDLRDPLYSINLYLDMAGKDLELVKRKDILESTSAIARSVSNMVENLLFWGRSQGKQLALHIEKCVLDDVIRDVLVLLEETARQKGINLIVASSPGREIECDRQMLLIILRNLVSNAVKFSYRANDVIINVDYPDDKVVIEVKDTGVGMNEEQIDAIFSEDLPQSTYGTGNEKGTGLGLRLCLDLIRLHGGNMQFESSPGRGTKVVVEIPAENQPEQA